MLDCHGTHICQAQKNFFGKNFLVTKEWKSSTLRCAPGASATGHPIHGVREGLHALLPDARGAAAIPRRRTDACVHLQQRLRMQSVRPSNFSRDCQIYGTLSHRL